MMWYVCCENKHLIVYFYSDNSDLSFISMFVLWTHYCNSYYSSDNHGFLKITNFKPLKKDILCKLVMQNSTPLHSYHEMFQGHVCKVLLHFLCQPISLNLTWPFLMIMLLFWLVPMHSANICLENVLLLVWIIILL